MEIKVARIVSSKNQFMVVLRSGFYSDCSFGKNIAANVPRTILDLLEHKSTFLSIRPKREPPLLLANKIKSNKIMSINKFVRNLSLKKVFISGKVNFKIAYFHFQISRAPAS